ncbi:MAG TPA: HAD hydrolase-like protein, partial [Polyangia bacterium]|nr:HAD hydrolase-like protein [Polyangia bacterium]
MIEKAPRAVIFDLDGTLADSALDFDAIRAEIGLEPGLPILEQLVGADAETCARAEVIMRRHERDAIAGAQLTDGCAELLALCAQLGAVPAETLTVGDYKFDVLAGRRAGCPTVL